MTTYTKQDFIAALECAELSRDLTWTHETDEGPDGQPGNQYGTMTGTLSLTGGAQITRDVGWQHPLHKGSQVTFDEDEARWDFGAMTVMDDDGEPMADAALAALVGELVPELADAPDGVFTDDETQADGAGIEGGELELEEFVVARDNAPNLCFHGELLARVSTSPNSAHGSDYSGSPGRWTTLKLYRTKGGKYVAAKVGHTQWQGEKTRYSAEVCATVQGVIDFFGHGWLSKDLYEEAGIDDVLIVD